jgi:TolB-like protein/DNA-binding winged helix-turn-helix (wHTH) protein/Tfp pilus assembly protein PilF
MSDATQTSPVRRFGAFEIDLQSGELRKHGMRLRLSGQPARVLTVLIEHAGEIVAREELHFRLWPADTFVDFDHGLNNAVGRIREVLDDSSDTPRYVETIPRRGYRFIAPLSDLRPATVLPAAESNLAPGHKIAPPNASGPAVLPPEFKGSSTRLRVLLTGIVLLALLICGFAIYRGIRAKATIQPPIKSVAVLPLKNISSDPNQEYLADGMTEALIGRLAGIRDLRVTSRTSVMQFKDTHMSAPEIAKALHVDALVEGSVMREGNRVRVHAQLIRAASDEHFWSETYDRDFRDALALQSDVARAIAEKVEVTVTGKEHERLTAARPVSPEAYESYLKGRYTLDKSNSSSGIEESIGYFQDAINRDPSFASAYLGLASAFSNLGTIFVGGATPSQSRPKVVSAARKALELDPDLAEAHLFLADTLQRQWHWAEAEAEYRRALELSPNDAVAHAAFADWLMCQGRLDEALAWAKRGRELDPLAVSGDTIGWILFVARRYSEATRELRSVLAVHPDDVSALWDLGFVLIAEGRPQEAIPILEKTVALTGRSPGAVELLATAYARAGNRTQALRLIDELKQRQKTGYVPAGAFINPYLGLGDYNEAFIWFERAYQEQSNILQFLKVHPFFDPVRNDPRFADLLHRVDLDQQR